MIVVADGEGALFVFQCNGGRHRGRAILSVADCRGRWYRGSIIPLHRISSTTLLRNGMQLVSPHNARRHLLPQLPPEARHYTGLILAGYLRAPAAIYRKQFIRAFRQAGKIEADGRTLPRIRTGLNSNTGNQLRL
ncbi:hypothetical protein CCY01nite_51110 [Chitinophaga cymbidii]|uniref:Uncharacterized protein n=1 Tax=Chitinophaga cymbidii TaxID=1096750 RepID=A0A512RT23_9BACT|nr:hypothetical protein CCY01nite_51110 [Chitinophaga cymbidii]